MCVCVCIINRWKNKEYVKIVDYIHEIKKLEESSPSFPNTKRKCCACFPVYSVHGTH